jgi:hypothetical protein
MVYTATARWNFRGETWFSVEIEAADLDLAGALFYSMLPTTFFRGKSRLVAIRPQGASPFDPKLLREPVRFSELGVAEPLNSKRPAGGIPNA